MNLSIGFSPCPNDTFIFDALVHGLIDTEGISFTPSLEDVQTLNESAMSGQLDITKLSFGVLPRVLHYYKLLHAGSALGQGVGPLLIAKENLDNAAVNQQVVAIPGENTTAHLLFSLKYPAAKNKVFLRYDAIEDFVLTGQGLGVIIHENRFTYEARGLKKICDLGDYWEQQNHVPIPLGGIVIRKNFEKGLQQKVNRLIRKSIDHAFSRYPVLSPYVKEHAQEMSEAVMRKHIDLYVNNYSLDLTEPGRAAVMRLMEVFSSTHAEPVDYDNVFV